MSNDPTSEDARIAEIRAEMIDDCVVLLMRDGHSEADARLFAEAAMSSPLGFDLPDFDALGRPPLYSAVRFIKAVPYDGGEIPIGTIGTVIEWYPDFMHAVDTGHHTEAFVTVSGNDLEEVPLVIEFDDMTPEQLAIVRAAEDIENMTLVPPNLTHEELAAWIKAQFSGDKS